MLGFIVFVVIVVCVLRFSKLNKVRSHGRIQVKSNLKTPFGNIGISQDRFNCDQIESTKDSLDSLSELTDEQKEKFLKGDVKIITNVNKKVTRYENGEKVTEEVTNSVDQIDKKAINQCSNCGASIDLNQDICPYCGTKIN